MQSLWTQQKPTKQNWNFIESPQLGQYEIRGNGFKPLPKTTKKRKTSLAPAKIKKKSGGWGQGKRRKERKIRHTKYDMRSNGFQETTGS